MEDCKKKINILYVSHYASLLGANRSLLGIISQIQERKDFSVSVLLPSKGEMSDALDELGVPYYIFKYYKSFYQRKKNIDILKALIKELFNFFAVFILFLKFRKCRIDIIHTNSSVSNIGAYLSILLKTKHIWHFREFAKQHYSYSYSLGESNQCFLWNRCSDKIITVSKELQNYYSTLLFEKKIVTIYNGISLIGIDDNCPKKENFFDIALVGVIHPHKHQDVVIKALSLIVNEYHLTNVHLHIWGNSIDAEYFSQMQKLVVADSLDDYVTFYGYQKDVVDQMKKCHIGIVASEFEAFGRVTVEYMMNRMITIGSRSGANIELIQDNVNGYLFELNNHEQLAEKLVFIINNYLYLSDLLTSSLLTSKRFSIESSVDKILNMYKECLEDK